MIRLRSGYTVLTDESDSMESLMVTAPGGRMCLKIQLTDAGPVLELQGVSLKLTAQKDLSLTCESLEINAEKEMIMRTKGDMVQAADRNISIMAKGAMQTNASSQYLRARTGDFEVKANDDVLLDGERVRLNSPRAAC